MSIIPFLWFADHNAEEAINYYCSIFPDSSIQSIRRYPDEKLEESFTGMTGKVLTAEFRLKGQKFRALDGRPVFRFSEAISMLVECKDQDELDYYWEKLSHVPESEQCGWCKDRYGLSWQIVPESMASLMQSDAALMALKPMKKITISDLEKAAKAG